MNPKIWLLFLFLSVTRAVSPEDLPGNHKDCRIAFTFQPEKSAIPDTMMLCRDSVQLPSGYQAVVNMEVCDDTLCARLILKLNWDLSGNFSGFDTLPGNPLTKFDHGKFTSEDYRKLDQILKDKNSALRVLEKEDLVDQSIRVKATTVDAFTGATPATIKKSIVEGAVYTSYSLWHLVNGILCDSIRAFTLKVYSDAVSERLLKSGNYESQLFALRLMKAPEFEERADLIFLILQKSNPLVRAYVLNKIPLPFRDPFKNPELVKLYPVLDNYSKSIFINRIVSSKKAAEVFIPLFRPPAIILDQKHMQKLNEAAGKFRISK
jgi:hypothetical protein